MSVATIELSEDKVLRMMTPRVFVPLLQPARYKGAWGGRGSGKSHHFAGALVEDSLEDASLRSLCVREYQKSLEFSSKQLIEDKIAAANAGYYFHITDKQITRRGGEHGGKPGKIIFQGMQAHNDEGVKSLEGFKRAWGEEAQSLSETSLKKLRFTIREPDSQLWFSWNPHRRTDAIDKLLRGPIPPKNAIVVRANYMDNPWSGDDLREDMEHDRIVDPDGFPHTWLGEYLKDHALQLIANGWVIAAREREFAEDGSLPTLRVTVDVADGGVDENVITVAKRYATFDLLLRQETFNFPSSIAPLAIADEAERMFYYYGGKKGEDDIVVDSMGVGAGTTGQLMQSGHQVVAYKGGAAGDAKNYRNRRVQSHIACRDAFRDNKVIIDPNFVDDVHDWEDFEDQICSVRRRPGLEKVEDIELKEQVKARTGRSPDRLDSLVMLYATQVPVYQNSGEEEILAAPGVAEGNYDAGISQSRYDGGLR